jgi:hypothetical protein
VAVADLQLRRLHPTLLDPSMERCPRDPDGFGGLGRCKELRNHARLLTKHLTRVKVYFKILSMSRKLPPSKNQWEGPWQDLDQPLDTHDVAIWFAQNPTACVADSRAQKVLRDYESPHRPWYDQSRYAEMVKRQAIPWWEDLRQNVRHCGVGDQLAPLFSDYLAGYALVREHDQGLHPGVTQLKAVREPDGSPRGRLRFKADPRRPGRITPEWRQAKRKMKKESIGSGPSLRLPSGEHLRTRLISQMENALVDSGSGWKREFCGRNICLLWELIEEKIVDDKQSSNDLADQTIARISRRSRSRKITDQPD